MLVLGISGGIIFLLPYLKEIYYRPLADALGLSNTQVGLMMSAFGVTALISYFPGGWLADRYSPRALIATSMITTGLLGFYFATFPGFVARLGRPVGRHRALDHGPAARQQFPVSVLLLAGLTLEALNQCRALLAKTEALQRGLQLGQRAELGIALGPLP